MSAMTCDRCRGLLLVDADAARLHADLAAHLAACAECRRLAEALRAGEQAWRAEDDAAFRDRVLARTSEADVLAAELRGLAEMDPGPGFAERVLLHTSERPAVDRWRANWVGAWRALVRRPRFAWEAAYVATLCLVVAFGNPLSAWEWGSGRVSAIAQQRLGKAASGLRQDLDAWRDSLADNPPAAGAAATTAGEPSADSQSAFEAAWNSASTWVRSRLAQVVDAFLDLWQQVARWMTGDEPGSDPASAGEPRDGAARSPQ